MYTEKPSSAGVTRLRFVQAEPTGARRRRRRLSIDASGEELLGNLHTLGYFSAQVCLGTPGRRFDVIVDNHALHCFVDCGAGAGKKNRIGCRIKTLEGTEQTNQ